MPIASLLIAYLVLASVSLCILACVLSLYDRFSAELQAAAMLMVSTGVMVMVLAFASLLWMEGRRALQKPQPAPTHLFAAQVQGGATSKDVRAGTQEEG